MIKIWNSHKKNPQKIYLSATLIKLLLLFHDLVLLFQENSSSVNAFNTTSSTQLKSANENKQQEHLTELLHCYVLSALVFL